MRINVCVCVALSLAITSFFSIRLKNINKIFPRLLNNLPLLFLVLKAPGSRPAHSNSTDPWKHALSYRNPFRMPRKGNIEKQREQPFVN